MTGSRQILQQMRTNRADLTDWAIHWTRDTPECAALLVLLKIIADGVLLAGYARRGQPSRPTIYGPRPAVCFTEQPLLEFAHYVKVRGDSSVVSGYGIAVHREDLYAEGGLPVISGLECPCGAKKGDAEYRVGMRNLKVACGLPLLEQFRYVAFAPNNQSRGGGGIPRDWSHEREWRWPEQEYVNWKKPLCKGFPIAGSGGATRRGASQGRFHVIVARDADVAKVERALKKAASSVCAEIIPAQRYRKAIPNARIFTLETVLRKTAQCATEYAKIETYP